MFSKAELKEMTQYQVLRVFRNLNLGSGQVLVRNRSGQSVHWVTPKNQLISAILSHQNS